MKKLMLTVFALSALLVGCGDDDAPSLTGSLTLSITDLEDLGGDFVYEGWVIVAGAPVSTGTFTVDAEGVLSASTFTVNSIALETATDFVLSVEPAGETGAAAAAPSDIKILKGTFSGSSASVSTSDIIADFSNAAGTMFLRTPTDEVPGSANNGNDFNGVWFGIPGMPPAAGLTLPTLPTGWAYEGWVVNNGVALSTGTFTAFGVVDSGNGFSGTENNAGPPIPGEDFFLNAPAGQNFPLDVRGRTVVISVEPVPDNSVNPFLLKPLIKTLDADAATAPATHAFGKKDVPAGTVTR